MEVKKEQIARYSGKPVFLVSLRNDKGAVVNILTFGAIVKDIFLPGLNGSIPDNMVLSYDTVDEYIADPHYIGCIVGRYANRIAGGMFTINDQTCQLTKNEEANQNHLHGGYAGFNKKLWDTRKTFVNETECGVSLALTSRHLEEGYPGNLNVEVSYVLSNLNELTITYRASTDIPTVVNLTNHSYFNLSGGKRDISDHNLSIYADEYTPADETYIPFGNIESVDQSIYDLRNPQKAGAFMHQVDTLNYCLNNNKEFKLAALLSDPDSGRTLEVRTTCPGLQLYCGNYLSGRFEPFAGICLEPHYFPDSPNHMKFPSSVLNPGVEYYEVSSYKFG